jgi:predicted 2-oxoglutarate/Fe(II)-dependent dioxygenase YbiX
VQLVSRDAFRGGRLTMAENETYDLDIGDGVIFPAQTIHTVSTLEEGERYVLAAWIQGPNFV